MTVLPEIPVRDCRHGGLLALATDDIGRAEALMDRVLAGLGPAGRLAGIGLPLSDRVALRWMRKARDPYLDEVIAIREAMGRAGPPTFALSYEFGCTARAFEGSPPTLFRTLDWPFQGLGALVEIVRLSGPAGDWVTATWPGVVGVLHGAAPGRFAAALNQAPARRVRLGPIGLGQAADWLAGKAGLLRRRAIPPPHLLRQVFETAPDFETARAMLRDTPVAAPVIYTLAGPGPEQRVTIERTEEAAAVPEHPIAANDFAAVGAPERWRPRGIDSAGRRIQMATLAAPPDLAAPEPPILNDLTRLSLTADAAGRLAVMGWDGPEPATRPRHWEHPTVDRGPDMGQDGGNDGGNDRDRDTGT